MFVDAGFIVPLSNFGGKGPAPVGTYQGMTCRGIYDMAGNVKEWCFNEAPDGWRVIAGGAWNEPQCMFGEADKCAPFCREANFGFRCMKPLSEDGIWQQAAGSVRYNPPPVRGNQEPCSEDAFQAYRRLYDYNKVALQPAVETQEDLSPYTRREKVSFNAAYGNERVTAYLYLPRTGKGPFQTVVHFPAASALSCHSITNYAPPDTLESYPRNGRALVIPVLQGTFERIASRERQARTTSLENAIMWAKDFRRTLDYLETRPGDFDTNKLAYSGASWGGVWGGILPAIDSRIKVAAMGGGGLWPDYPQEYNQINFAPRIKIPILLQNGKYDPQFPVESNQKAYLKLFGTAEEHKHYKPYETGHSIWSKNEWLKDERDFLDQYLGPAK